MKDTWYIGYKEHKHQQIPYDIPATEGGDYGEYDYYYTDKPQDQQYWMVSLYTNRCEGCGKERHIIQCTDSYFYTLDGYDSMNYRECWRCVLKSSIRRRLNRIKRPFKKIYKIVKDFLKLRKAKCPRKDAWEFAVSLNK